LGQQAPSVLKGGLSFTTLPVSRFGTVDGQAVNMVDPDEITKTVQQALEPDDAPDAGTSATQFPAATIDIVNGTGRDGLAAGVAEGLSRRGLTPGTLSTKREGIPRSSLVYNPAAHAAAIALVHLLNDPSIVAVADPDLATGHLRLAIGAGFTVPARMTPDPTTGNPATDTGPSSPTGVPASNLDAGGIPCVK
jgi:LytR cell envelope-related transcriptional attenuator